jgi:hypothetical protein
MMIDLFAERRPVELIEYGTVEALRFGAHPS